MAYTKEQIRKWCGIHWTKLDNILKELDEKDIDWASADWPTICSEASDFGDIEEAIWSHLKSEGIVSGRIISESQLGHEMEKYEAGEEEFLQDTKEGVKEILKRIYKDPSISKKQKERMKEVLKQESSAYYATLIALYNGEAQSFAKRWLGEEVIAPTPEDVKLLIDKPVFSVLSKRGWIKAIDGVYLKQPMRSTKFVKLIPECKLIHSEERGEPGRVAVYRKTEPEYGKPSEFTRKPFTHEELVEGYKKEYEKIGEKPPILSKPDEKELTILQNIDNAKRHLELFKKRKDETMIEETEMLLGNYKRILEAYRRLKEKGELIPPAIEEKPVITAETTPQPEKPTVILKAPEIILEPKSEDLILQYGYSELKKIARDKGIRVSGSKAKMIEKLLEVGAL